MNFIGEVNDLIDLGFKCIEYGTIREWEFQHKGSKISVVFPSRKVYVWCKNEDDFLEDRVMEKLFSLKERELLRKDFRSVKITDNRKVK